MKFENKGKWFNESEDTDKDMFNDEQQDLAMEDNSDDLLAEDELDLAEEDIDDDSEGIFNKEVDKKPEQKNERHLFKKGDRVNALGNTGTIASVYYEDPAETRKRFKVLMDKNKKVEVFTEPELRFVESIQKNEKAYKVNGKTLKIGDKVYYNLYGTDYTGTIVNFKDYNDNPVVVAHKDNTKDLQLLHPSEIIKVESAQKNESWFDLYPVVSEIGTDWEFYKKKPKYTRNELKQAAITKLKAKGKSFNSQDLEEALNRWYASESAQMNESRNWKVVVELSSPDNMNNADVEDAVEYYLDKPAGFNVFDVTATRK